MASDSLGRGSSWRCCAWGPAGWLMAAMGTGILALDQLTKRAVADWLPHGGSYPVVDGFFNLVHARNTGIAFSLFADSAPWVRNFALPAASLAAVALILTMVLRSGQSGFLTRSALSMILAGAAGNLADRWTQGYVTDFLDFYVGNLHWPSFNVADSAITVGVALMLAESFRGDHQPSSGRASRTGLAS